MNFGPGIHVYNYIDKPDFDMNTLVKIVYQSLGRNNQIKFRLPYAVGYGIGKIFDFAAIVSGKKFPISSIRVKKFCSNSSFETSVAQTGFIPPVSIYDGLKKTIEYEFINKYDGEVFYSE